jgi:anthranilate phosphoribosyltransferase
MVAGKLFGFYRRKTESHSVSRTDLPAFSQVLADLLDHRDLSAGPMTDVFERLLSGQLGDGEAAAFLIALRMKGETAEELAAAAAALRAKMLRFETGRELLLDTCGTGGDDAGTFNISTAAAILAAASGVPVVKHGNRAVSSHSGSADVLAELGMNLEGGPDAARRSLDRVGFAFCFAPHFHPVLKQIAPLRKRLGVRTILNLLGPLANPAGATHQLIGVGDRRLLDPMARALARLGTRQAYVVSSEDGLDEVSLSAPTLFRRVCQHAVMAGRWTHADFGLEPCTLFELRADDAGHSARFIEDVVRGRPGPARRIVLANAAAALLAAERVADLRAGVTLAERAISSGAAMTVLEGLRASR